MTLKNLGTKAFMIIRSRSEFNLWVDHSSLLYFILKVALQIQTLKHREFLEVVNP